MMPALISPMTRGSLRRSNQWPKKWAATTRTTREKRNRVSEWASINAVLLSLGRGCTACVANARVDALTRDLKVLEIVIVAPGAAFREDRADRDTLGRETLEGFGKIGRDIAGANQFVDLIPQAMCAGARQFCKPDELAMGLAKRQILRCAQHA